MAHPLDAHRRGRLWHPSRGGRPIAQPRELQIGVLTPHATPGPELEFPLLASGRPIVTRVAQITIGTAPGAGSDPPITASALRALADSALVDAAADTFRGEPVDAVGYASTTSGYVIGYEAEAAMVSRLAARLALPVAATCAAAVLGLQALEVERLALVGAPWFDDENNELGAAYFRSQGFDVVFSRSAALAQDPEPAAVCAWMLRQVPDEAEAIFIGGNGFRTARAIEPLERALGRPVLTANQALLWRLLTHVGAPCDVAGYGRLFAESLRRQRPA
jgi:maleate isomerase